MSHKELPYLGCNIRSPNACCGDRRFGCCNNSATRYSVQGPAELTGQWDIGAAKCASGLNRCKGKCGNEFCSHGDCPDSTPQMIEGYKCGVRSNTKYVGNKPVGDPVMGIL